MKKLIIFLVLCLFAVSSSAQTQTAEKPKMNVAILIFDGVQIIDYTGPYEVLGSHGKRKVYTVAENADTVTTAMGMKVIPNYTFENQPKPDIIVIPGGGYSKPDPNGRGVAKQMVNEKVIRWIRDNAKEAKHVMSVCNGAFLLAQAGLLDGLEATTFHGMIKDLPNFAKNVKVFYDKRFVDNGKIITTAGLSSGIDGSLHLIEKIDGIGWAKRIAAGLEYNWQPESNYARASLADMKFPKTIDAVLSDIEPIDITSERTFYDSKWTVRTPLSVEDFMISLNKAWSAAPGWTTTKIGKSDGVWKLTEKDGKVWIGEAKAEKIPDNNNELMMVLKIRRI
ncbi:MAG: DJ-1/PfpI family protein [Acidobacteria bacterium]|nr:DJ-1/PfpI family protein [Acidobacteriota bacterium]MBP9108603.1 DJ-1/PfpI family protein [Pyrinomonadaceae bacterium]